MFQSRIFRAFGPGFGPGFARGPARSSTPPILRLSFTVAALLQMLAYALEVLWAVIIGPVDPILPARVAFVGIVLVLVAKPFDDFSIAWNNRKYDPQGAEDALLYFGVVLLAAGVAILYDLFFIVHPLASIDLTTETIGVRAFVGAGAAILIWFVYGLFRPILGFPYRKLKGVIQRRKQVAAP